MARVNTYLNFMGKTEEAFNFYKDVFGTEITSLTRMKDMPRPDGAPQLGESEANLIMNIQLPITNGHVLMATDMIASMGHNLKVGNNVTISLDLDSQEDAEKIYKKTSHQLTRKFWTACTDAVGSSLGVMRRPIWHSLDDLLR